MAKRLFIDLAKCDKCPTCAVRCAYFYQPGADDHGMAALREQAALALVCRRCDNPSCVASCRFEALERGPDNVLSRHNMRCVSCKCCSQACPFGTLYPELTPFYAARCDYCLDRIGKGDPACAASCPEGAVAFAEVQESEKENIWFVNDRLAVKAVRWKQKD
jgi:Fe-S-cluster-containing dehydrogenase component